MPSQFIRPLWAAFGARADNAISRAQLVPAACLGLRRDEARRLVASASFRPKLFSSDEALATKRLPLPRWASAIQIVCPLECTAETQPQLQPALLRLSAMISQYFTLTTLRAVRGATVADTLPDRASPTSGAEMLILDQARAVPQLGWRGWLRR